MNFNSRETRYKNPFGAVKCGENIRIRFPIAEWVPVGRVLMYLRKEEEIVPYELSYAGKEDGHNIFELNFRAPAEGIWYYRFEMHNLNGTWYYGRGANGESLCGENLPEWQLTVYKHSYKTPDFAKGGIMYHIFADRFCRDGEVKTEREYRLHESWDESPEVVRPDGKYYADDFFGGNLRGIEKKLPYLKSLGVSIIYLSPIFQSFSNHRYDTGDYLKIDPLLGTEDDFKRLAQEAKEEGVSIIFDGVFNHSGADSVYFNKYGHYDTVGAYQSKNSPYYNWYYFNKFPDDYACWWGCKNVPDLNKSNEGYRHLIFGVGGVIEKWTAAGVAGWRLDVVDELPVDFTYRLCESIRRHNKNALIIGEVWEDASTKVSYGALRPYLLGGQLDSVMNYPFKNAIIDYILSGNGGSFSGTIMSILENYPKESVDCLMNILGTHDTVRILNAVSGVDVSGTSKSQRLNMRLEDWAYAAAKNRLKLATVLQYTLPGIPCVYYGDEAGVQGYEDPINRRPFPWGKEDLEITEHYRLLGKIRNDNKEILTGGFEFMRSDCMVIYKRYSAAGELIAVVNNSDGYQEFTFDKDYEDILNGNILYKKGENHAFAPNSAAILKYNG